MSQQNNIWELAEAYINHQLSEQELSELEERRANEYAFASEFQDCVDMLLALKGNGAQKRVRQVLQQAHSALAKPEDRTKKPFNTRRYLWRTAAIAACIAIITSVATYWVVQVNNRKIESKYSLLRRDLEKYKRSQNKIIRDIKEQTESPYVNARYTATGFALTNNGFISYKLPCG